MTVDPDAYAPIDRIAATFDRRRVGAMALAGLASAVAGPASSRTLIELLVVIAVHDGTGKLVQTVTTDRNGGFMLKGLFPGPHTFKISGESLTRAVTKANPDVADSPAQIAVLVALLLPAVSAVPCFSEQFALPLRRSGGGGGAGKVSLQDLSFTKMVTAPDVKDATRTLSGGAGGGAGGTAGISLNFAKIAWDYRGKVSLTLR